MINFLDTSAILAGGLDSFFNIYISPIVISELENIKTDRNKDDDTKFFARQVVREIIQNNEYSFTCFAQKDILKEISRHPFLTDINDHRILSEAILLSKKTRQPVHFVTSDGTLYLFAKQIKEIDICLKEELQFEFSLRQIKCLFENILIGIYKLQFF